MRIGTPLLSEGSGEAVGAWGGFLYLYISFCKTDSYNGVCGTYYSSTPKNDCFQNKLAYLCKQKETAPPDLPERGGVQIARLPQEV
ncbi:hypothetical protein HMPREF9969_0730 [Prevotella sp. oral taxon 306 str. F0472]|nr:hypothetical protein HMPREF9969_0730 [Prevotella sp. oral taxon 306 str. F0472]